jgi:hypothetical protein
MDVRINEKFLAESTPWYNEEKSALLQIVFEGLVCLTMVLWSLRIATCCNIDCLAESGFQIPGAVFKISNSRCFVSDTEYRRLSVSAEKI